jgi:hypothetical protein
MMNGGVYTGYEVEDSICLDDDEDICIQKLTFYEITDSQNITDDPERLFHNGVIPWNRYGIPDRANQRLINILDYEDILYSYTIHFDFNFPASMFEVGKVVPKSSLYINGFEKSLIKYINEPNNGIVWNDNVNFNSTWKLNITDLKWKE